MDGSSTAKLRGPNVLSLCADAECCREQLTGYQSDPMLMTPECTCRVDVDAMAPWPV